MIYCTEQGEQPIFYNNMKWNIITNGIGNFESLSCIPETNNIVN